MRISLPELNAFVIFCLFPWISLGVPALFGYPIILALMVLNRKWVPFIAMIACLAFALLFVYWSPIRLSLTDQQFGNAINTSFGWLLILVISLLKPTFLIRPNQYTVAGIFGFTVISTIRVIFFWLEYKAVVQIMGITVAMFFAFADRPNQKLLVVFYLVMSGGRANLAGFALAWLWDRAKYLRTALSVPAFIGLVALVISGSAFTLGLEQLEALREQQILMKGRTNFWIGLLGSEPGLFGNGAGSSLKVIEQIQGSFQLPHNDWLRIYADFGTAGVVVTIVAMFRILLRKGPARFATIVLAASMVFDNTLSYPTAMTAYFLVCLSRFPFPDQDSASAQRVRSSLRSASAPVSAGT